MRVSFELVGVPVVRFASMALAVLFVGLGCSQPVDDVGVDEVGVVRATLRESEASRAEEARSITDPAERLNALAALANDITHERARAAGLVDGEGRARRGVAPTSIADRFAGVRAALLADVDEAGREVEARLLTARLEEVQEQGRVFGAAEQAQGRARMLEYAEREVRAAGLNPEEEARILGIVQSDFGVREREPRVQRTEEEMNPPRTYGGDGSEP